MPYLRKPIPSTCAAAIFDVSARRAWVCPVAASNFGGCDSPPQPRGRAEAVFIHPALRGCIVRLDNARDRNIHARGFVHRMCICDCGSSDWSSLRLAGGFSVPELHRARAPRTGSLFAGCTIIRAEGYGRAPSQRYRCGLSFVAGKAISVRRRNVRTTTC